jgi:hypothetical protein
MLGGCKVYAIEASGREKKTNRSYIFSKNNGKMGVSVQACEINREVH